MKPENFLSSMKKLLGKQSINNILIDLKEDINLDLDKMNAAIYQESLILVSDLNGEIIFINNKFSASLGYKSKELIGKHTRELNSGIHPKEYYRGLWMTILSGKVWKGEITAKNKEGGVTWYFMVIVPLLDEINQVYQFLSLRYDITSQKSMEKLANLKEKQFDSFNDIHPNTFFGCMNQNGNIVYLSPAIENILGYKFSETLKNIYDLISPSSLSKFKELVEEIKTIPGSRNLIEIKIRSNNGSYISGEFTAKNYLQDPILNAIVFSFRDITKEKEIHQEINKKVSYDSITGLPNEIFFQKDLHNELELAAKSKTNLAIVKLGLDDLKYINSSLGFELGDLLLKDVSNRLNTNLPENIALYREYGDKFLLLIKGNIDVKGLEETLSSFISIINEKPFNIKGNEIYVTGSMGVSIYPYSGVTKEELLKNAEVAMFRAKNHGKNQYQIFAPTMSVQSYKQFILRNDSKQALLRDQFSVYYQPRINPFTNEMVSAEALIRWKHPKWGLVVPDEFISMAEDSGLIVPIGEWLIRKVCIDLKKWELKGLSFKKISINLSAIQLIQPNFVQKITSILNELNVNPKWIEFEITENVIIEKEEAVLHKIIQLSNLGITFALDDFGTGYSSLNYLKNFPCEMIKIDKSLIKEIHKEKENLVIIGSIISLCHKLNKKVVAEGVETKEQLMILRNLSCDEIQGYLYSKPVEYHAFEKLLIGGIEINAEKSVVYPFTERRKFTRVPFEIPMVADMTICEMEGIKLNIGSSEVKIKNIGPGGLSFFSPLLLPVSRQIVLQFITEILTEKMTLKGTIVWFNETDDNYQYGVKFASKNGDEDKLIRILNNLQIKLNNKPILPGNSYYKN